MRHEHDQMRHEHDQMRHEHDQMRHEHDQGERKTITYSLFDGQLYHLVGELVLRGFQCQEFENFLKL